MKLSLLIKLVFASAAVLFFNACDDVEHVVVPDLNITTESNTYKVGDLVEFDISGHADYIKFFSGEKGNDYAFSSVDRIVNTLNVDMSFTTEYQNGGQTNDLVRLVYSTNFDGDYSASGIDKATWIDITDRCTMPTAISNNNNPLGIASSSFNVYDLFPNEETVVHFAFRYHIKGPSSTHGQRTNAIISAFRMGYDDDENNNHVLLEQATTPWKLFGYLNYENEASNTLSTNATRIVFSCAANPPVDKIAYAVTSGISVPKLANQGPDWAVTVKDYQQSQVTSFIHAFQTAGEYEVVFVGSNVYGSEVKDQIYKLRLTITD